MKKLPTEYLFVDKNANLFYKNYKEKKVKAAFNPYTLGSTPVLFAKDATIQTIFDLVEKEPALKEICFYADAFLKEAKEDSKFTDINGNIRFYWPELQINDECGSNFYSKMEVDGKDENGEIFGIDFLKACDIKNLGLEIDPKLKIVKEDGFEELASTTMFPTLFQVVYGLFWELSFFGNPEDREAESKKIQEAIVNLKKDFDTAENK